MTVLIALQFRKYYTQIGKNPSHNLEKDIHKMRNTIHDSLENINHFYNDKTL